MITLGATMNRSALSMLGLVFVVAGFTWGRSAAADPPSERLADYFGFLPIELYKLDNGIGNLALKDLDGDGASDVIVSNNRRSRIDLLLSSKKPADDKSDRPFRKDINELDYDHRMRLVSIPVNKQVESLETGDFNGDGKADIVFFGAPAELQILYNEGNGHFSAPKKIAIGEASERSGSMAIGDFDQDGRDDVALLAEKELIFVYQPTAGTMSEPERVPHTAASPWLIKAVDLNGDGAKDLVMLDSSGEHPYHARFATVEKKLGPEQRFTGETPRAISFGQMDGKGGVEILALEGQTSRARVLTLDESGTDESEKLGRLSFFALPLGGERGRSLSVGDLDGDGQVDVTVTDPANAQVWTYLQSRQVGLSNGRSFPSLSGSRVARSAPTRHGKGEALYVLSDSEKQIGRSTFENGRLSFPTPLPVEGDPVAMDVGDFNGDTLADVVYVARTAPGADKFALRWLAADKTDTFQHGRWGKQAFLDLPSIKNTPAAMTLIDVNQDGLLDVVIFNSYGPPTLLLSRKEGAPRPIDSLGAFASATPAGLSLTQLDGPAILVAQNTFARRLLLDPQDHWIVKDQYNAGQAGAVLQGAVALDVDGDGTKEIVAFDKSSKSLIFLARKDGVYRPAGRLLTGAIAFDGLHVADFDGDKRDDLLIAGTDRFGLLQTGRKGLRLKPIADYESKRTKARLSDLAAGDVNGDGVPDVVFSDTAEQSLEIASFTGEKDLLHAITFKIYEKKTFRNVADLIEPRDMVLGDINGDRKTDIVLVIHDRVLIYRQDPGSTTTAKPAPTASK